MDCMHREGDCVFDCGSIVFLGRGGLGTRKRASPWSRGAPCRVRTVGKDTHRHRDTETG